MNYECLIEEKDGLGRNKCRMVDEGQEYQLKEWPELYRTFTIKHYVSAGSASSSIFQ